MPSSALLSGLVYIFLCCSVVLPTLAGEYRCVYKKLIRRWDTRTWQAVIAVLRLTPPTEGFRWDDLRKILQGGQTMAKVQNGEEILPKVPTPWVGRTNVTDDRRICNSKDPNLTWSRSRNNQENRRRLLCDLWPLWHVTVAAVL